MKHLSPQDKKKLVRLCRQRERRRIHHNRAKAQRRAIAQARLITYQSRILTSFTSGLGYSLKHKSRSDQLTINIPKIFSFIENPDESLKTLYDLARACRQKGINKIFIDHSKCETLDLGASLVMDVLAVGARNEWRIQQKKCTFSGKYPDNLYVREILETSGLLKHLEIPPDVSARIKEEKWKLFPLRNGNHRFSATRSSEAELAASDLTKYFNACLSHEGHALTDSGKDYISKIVGEVLDNAGRHSGTNKWHLIGSYNMGSHRNECQIAMLNFGKSIYHSLNSDTTSRNILDSIELLIKHHKFKNFFNIMDKWSEEDLWCLYALQEGVSCRGDKKDPGYGTVDMINFFQKIGQSPKKNKMPKMTIISGSTQIIFDMKYRIRDEFYNEESRKIIAFNKSNDLFSRPDRNNVRSLTKNFPGTLVSLKFYIDGDYLETVTA